MNKLSDKEVGRYKHELKNINNMLEGGIGVDLSDDLTKRLHLELEERKNNLLDIFSEHEEALRNEEEKLKLEEERIKKEIEDVQVEGYSMNDYILDQNWSGPTKIKLLNEFSIEEMELDSFFDFLGTKGLLNANGSIKFMKNECFQLIIGRLLDTQNLNYKQIAEYLSNLQKKYYGIIYAAERKETEENEELERVCGNLYNFFS